MPMIVPPLAYTARRPITAVIRGGKAISDLVSVSFQFLGSAETLADRNYKRELPLPIIYTLFFKYHLLFTFQSTL